ncbi:UNKNOWN [Stylonychia lemnae]|uniref:Uncharacterized protein n=1 Tax=Stylonychia lemnae TaxID=5949 RepID=A0A078AAQ0_STYLE|nr:UNKNOWN [Stylonychia lemnae]|eukprot:CDW78667.1 UNKNOWN [Stylonychia lemnae]
METKILVLSLLFGCLAATKIKSNQLILAQGDEYGIFPNNLDIGDSQVAFYQHGKFGGAQMILDASSPRTYALSGNQRIGGSSETLNWWDNAISSIKVGKKAMVKLCRYQNCEDEKKKPENAVILVGPYSTKFMGWSSDYTSTIVLSPYDEANNPVVSVFGGDEFNCDTATVLKPGNYNSRDLKLNNIDPGEIRGFRVPLGLVLQIFDQDYQAGQDGFIQGSSTPSSQVDLYAQKNNNQPDKSQTNLGKFYRKVQSIKIGRANEIYPITARWVTLDSSWGNPLNVSVMQGLKLDTTKVSSTTFSASLSLGYKYTNGNPVTGQQEFSVSATVGFELQNSISSSIKKATQVTAEKICAAKGDQKVTMWQFQLSAEGALYGAENFICKYGDNADLAPSCISYMKCADAECTRCL